MNKKLIKLIELIDEDSYNKMTPAERKNVLLQICKQINKARGIDEVYVSFENLNPDISGNTGEHEILLNSSYDLNKYEDFILMFDTVIHECFHMFQNYLMALPSNFVEDITWNRIKLYKQQKYFSDVLNKDLAYERYRFSAFELDAYRHTDFVLRKIYKYLKSKNKNVEYLKKYIHTDRKRFYKNVATLNKHTKNQREQLNSLDYISNILYDKNFKKYKEQQIIMDDLSLDEIASSFENGNFGDNFLTGDTDYDISQKFLNNAETNFKDALPHLFSSELKHSGHNDSELSK